MSTGAYKIVADYTMGVSTNTNLQVFVRARPPAKGGDTRELASKFGISPSEPRRIELNNPTGGDHAFSFDRVFWTNTTQEEMFSTVCLKQVDHCLRGYNSCSFAYGQTGSGKTHTMFGGKDKDRGLIPRSVEYLFDQIPRLQLANKDVTVEASFLEIYCGKIRDLGRIIREPESPANSTKKRPSLARSLSMAGILSPKSPAASPMKAATSEGNHGHAATDGYVTTSDAYLMREAKRSETFGKDGETVEDYYSMDLEIHEDQMGEVFVKDLTQVKVSSCAETLKFVSDGFRLRATHETKMNNWSSRSHTIFTLKVSLVDKSTGSGTCARINLVDLAGSERLKRSESEGMRLKEALHINSSLTALGKVVVALDPKAGTGVHVPYRDDKLTRVLQNSLGGNSYTTLVATIHPNEEWMDECLSTLQFANRCRVVTNLPRVTYTGEETVEAKDKRIKVLVEENKQLRRRLVSAGIVVSGEENDLFDMLSGGGASGPGASGGSTTNVLQKQRFAIAQAANAMIIKVLAECGVSAKLSSDGRVELSDGRVVGHYCEAVGDSPAHGSNADEDVEDPLLEIMGGGGGGKKGDRSGVGSGNTDRLVRKVAMLQRESDLLRKKLVELRSKAEADATNFEVRLREQEHDLRSTAAIAQTESNKQRRVIGAAVEEATAALIAHNIAHNDEVKNLVNRSDEILRQQAQLSSIRAGLPISQQYDNQQDSGGAIFNHVKPSRAGKIVAAVAAAEFSKNAEIELLKQQYEHWLSMRDKEAARFVDQFNQYRAKSKVKVKNLESDLIRVFSYSQSMKGILDKLERGAYPMRSGDDSRILVPCIPRKDLPYEPQLLESEVKEEVEAKEFLAVPLHLPSIKAILHRKLSERKLAKGLETVGAGDGEGSIEHTAVSHALDTILGHFVRDNKVNTSPYFQGAFAQAAFRTKSIDSDDKSHHIGPGSLAYAARSRNTQQPKRAKDLHGRSANQIGESSSEEETEYVSNKLDTQDMEIEEVVALYSDSNIEKFEDQELKSALKSLRVYIETAVPEKLSNMVVSELESSETVQYISQLEEKLKARDDMVSDQCRQLNSLRHAKEALARRNKNAKTRRKSDVMGSSRVTTESVKIDPEVAYGISRAETKESAKGLGTRRMSTPM